jgi:two-component system, LuxR family, sensor kinase FixL
MAQQTRSIEKRAWTDSGSLKASSSTSQGKASKGSLEIASETTRLEDALQRSQLKARALLSVISDLVFIIRKDGVILEFHAPKENDLRLSPEGLVGKRIMELLPAQIGRQVMHYVEKALRTTTPQIFTSQSPLPSWPCDFEARLTVSSPGEVLALVRDVTERKLLQKEILEISHRERTRIGQDLHDGLGQHLTGITFLSRALENRLTAKLLPEAVEAAEISQLVLQALSQTRSLARGLFPVELESSGLVRAFGELATTVEKLFNITCRLECDEQVEIHNRTTATHLFRLVQEAINNSVKHGKAKLVVIGLTKADDQLVLTITDNGVGFSPKADQSKGLGLRIMKYRAQKIGAHLELGPAEKGGTRVRCTFQNTTDIT